MDFNIVGLPNDIANQIAEKLGKKLIVPQVIQFADGEIEIKFPEPEALKNKKIFIVQATSSPVHDTIMLLLSMIFEAKNAGAAHIIPVIPYFGYARHDKGVIPGTDGTAGLIARMIEQAGADKIITVALHSEKVADYFSIPVINVSLIDLITQHIKSQLGDDVKNTCLVAPDLGAQERVMAIAHNLGIGHIFFTKQRIGADKTEIVASEVHCKGKIAIMIDDIIDTGGTAINACNALVAQGYEQVFGYFIHPVLSRDATQKIEKSAFTALFVSNTIPLKSDATKIKQFDITNVLVEVIEKIQ